MTDCKKNRKANFSSQDCLLLAHIMGEKHSEMNNLTNHQLVKHRFTNGITSQVKRNTWKDVECKFNAASSEVRDADSLEKKWDNLISLHRAIYSDYLKSASMTGGGPVTSKYSLVTEAIMDVIGKETVSVKGASTNTNDTTFNQLMSMQSSTSVDSHTTAVLPGCSESSATVYTIPSVTEKTISRKRCSCHCHDELDDLKKKKLQFQIEYYKKKLQKLDEE